MNKKSLFTFAIEKQNNLLIISRHLVTLPFLPPLRIRLVMEEKEAIKPEEFENSITMTHVSRLEVSRVRRKRRNY
ncbi:CLUMA_CG001343, isoform A [Clunio marinus]|uniref:CLUMA_CG001343, isoform A n=1 Tax=Clunio marinus TaxID=568069 RepID=A0A1J1HJ10_9DIPT|nr:CLUMA_CG001343, isoform A [Clunio marinus]